MHRRLRWNPVEQCYNLFYDASKRDERALWRHKRDWLRYFRKPHGGTVLVLHTQRRLRRNEPNRQSPDRTSKNDLGADSRWLRPNLLRRWRLDDINSRRGGGCCRSGRRGCGGFKEAAEIRAETAISPFFF